MLHIIWGVSFYRVMCHVAVHNPNKLAQVQQFFIKEMCGREFTASLNTKKKRDKTSQLLWKDMARHKCDQRGQSIRIWFALVGQDKTVVAKKPKIHRSGSLFPLSPTTRANVRSTRHSSLLF
jgi:hypothetical protein